MSPNFWGFLHTHPLLFPFRNCVHFSLFPGCEVAAALTGLSSVRGPWTNGHAACTGQPYSVCTATASRLRPAHFLSRGSKHKNQALTNLLWGSIRSVCQMCSQQQQHMPRHFSPILRKLFLTEAQISRLPSWSAEPLTVTWTIQLALDDFFCAYSHHAHHNYIKKEGSGCSFTKTNSTW